MWTSFVSWWHASLKLIGWTRVKKAKLLLLGLDNAGKTTLLHVLRDDKVLVHEPTRHPQHEELVLGEITFSAHDLGGHKAARRVWNTYYSSVDAIIYLVDATDERRLLETGEELNKILSTPELEKVPVLILGNKVDIAWALKPERLCSQFGLKLTGKQGKPRYTDERPLELFMCSIVRRAGYAAGMQWLAKQVKV